MFPKNNENLTRYGFMASLNVDDDSDKFVLRHVKEHIKHQKWTE